MCQIDMHRAARPAQQSKRNANASLTVLSDVQICRLSRRGLQVLAKRSESVIKSSDLPVRSAAKLQLTYVLQILAIYSELGHTLFKELGSDFMPIIGEIYLEIVDER